MGRSGKKTGYLIVERSDSIYCYIEDSDHHEVAEVARLSAGLERVDHSLLDDECDISLSVPTNSYMVFSVVR